MRVVVVDLHNGINILSENFELLFHIDTPSAGSWVNDFDLSLDETLLAVGYYTDKSSTVVIWDIVNGSVLTHLDDPICNSANPVFYVLFVGDSDRLVTRYSQGRITIWNWRLNERLNVIETNWSEVCELFISLDGCIISGKCGNSTERTEKGMVAWWDPNTGEELKSVEFDARVSTITYSAHGDAVAVGLASGDIVIDAPSTKFSWQAGTSQVLQLCFVPDGSKIISSCRGAIILWDCAGRPGNMMWKREGSELVYNLSCACLLDGATVKLLCSSISKPDDVELIDCESGSVDRTFPGLRASFSCRSMMVLM